MARKHNLAEVLQTEVSGSMPLKTLAKVLAGKGRRGDTMLAHITPKEAKKLKKMGGSGTTNPETGLPEFFGEDGFDYPTFEAPAAPVEAPVQSTPDYAAGAQPVSAEVMSQFQSPQTTADYFSGYNPAADLPSYGAQEAGLSNYVSGLFGGGQQAGTLTSASGAPLPTPRGMTPEDAASYYSQGATPEDPGVQTQIQPTSEDVAKAQGGDSSGLLGKMGLSDLLKLGVGGIGALMGRSQQQAAIKQAAAAAPHRRVPESAPLPGDHSTLRPEKRRRGPPHRRDLEGPPRGSAVFPRGDDDGPLGAIHCGRNHPGEDHPPHPQGDPLCNRRRRRRLPGGRGEKHDSDRRHNPCGQGVAEGDHHREEGGDAQGDRHQGAPGVGKILRREGLP